MARRLGRGEGGGDRIIKVQKNKVKLGQKVGVGHLCQLQKPEVCMAQLYMSCF
jgi:5-formyltetrahydrofolate cyclo-ligase